MNGRGRRDSRLKVWQMLRLSESGLGSRLREVWADCPRRGSSWGKKKGNLNAAIDGNVKSHQGVEGWVVPLLRCWNKRAGKILSSGTDSSSCCISGHFGGFRCPGRRIYSYRAWEQIPGEKPDKRIKTQNITKDDSIPLCSPVCRSTGTRWEQKEDVGRCWRNQCGFGP